MRKIVIAVAALAMVVVVIISIMKDYNENDNILKQKLESTEDTSIISTQAVPEKNETKDVKSLALDSARRVDSNLTEWQGYEILIDKIEISKKIPDYAHVLMIEDAKVADGKIMNEYSCVTLSLTVTHREMIEDWETIYLNNPSIVSFDENDNVLEISEEIGSNNMDIDSKDLYQVQLNVGDQKHVDVSYWVKDECIKINNSVYNVDFGGAKGYNMELKTYLPLDFKEAKNE